MNLRCHYMKAGYCDALEYLAIKGGRMKNISFDAFFVLIQHPIEGNILFDTGYSRRFFDLTKSYPSKFLAKITKVSITKEEEAKSQLLKIGIEASSIRHVILSHFHADHVGGIKDFPNATFYCSKDAYKQLSTLKSKFQSIRKGILQGLFPADFSQRLMFFEDLKKSKHQQLGEVYDLFDDELIILTNLSGHAAGQFGALLETEEGEIFLVADACWLKKSYIENILPNRLAGIIFDSWTQYKKSLNKIHLFHLKNKDVAIVPSHCNQTTLELMKNRNQC